MGLGVKSFGVSLIPAAVLCSLAVSWQPTYQPPLIPAGSPTTEVPPWPIFRLAVAVNDFFEWAAWVTRPPGVQAKSLATDYWRSEVSYALAYHEVFDEVSVSGLQSCEHIAAKRKLNTDFLCRLMKAGEKIQVLASADGLHFSLTEVGKLFTKEHPQSMRPFLLMINEETRDAWRAAGMTSVKNGVSGFKNQFGEEFWSYHSRPEHQKGMQQFDAAMQAFSSTVLGSQLLDWAPPRPDAMVCDIGGGLGHVVAEFARHYPALHGAVFDQPHVADRAAKNFASLGLSDRLYAVGGSFLEPLPANLSSCDVFYMKHILHDWDDSVCIKILKNIKAVAKPGATVVSTDFIIGLDGAEMETVKQLLDINMMACNEAGARERSLHEYKALFASAGFEAEPTLIKLREVVSMVQAHV